MTAKLLARVFPRILAWGGLVAALAVPDAMWAQGETGVDDGEPRSLSAEDEALERLMTGDIADLDSEAFDESTWSFTAFDALRRGNNVRARELAEGILRRNPQSIAGHCLIGLVFHRAEGDLPKALFAFKTTERLIAASPLDDEEVQVWHGLTLLELAAVSGEMERQDDKLRYLDLYEEIFGETLPADRGWPLMRLRRYEEARDAVREALELPADRDGQKAAALTALCAIEAELQDRERSYQACLTAAQYEREQREAGPTPFTNAAEASLGLLRLDEAEKLIIEASRHFVVDSVSNPWLDLLHLYLAEGRIPEALDALRRMRSWRNRQPAYMDEQNRAETEMAGAIFLLIAGRAEEATRITRRIMDRPDRTGFTSSEPEQLRAANAIVDALAHQVWAENLAEQASWSPWRAFFGLRAKELAARARAWSSSRRAAAYLADERMLISTLRPYLAGSVELSEWLEPELFAALGAGIAQAGLTRARALEKLPAAEGYFQAAEAELARLVDDPERSLAAVERALVELPESEALLRARTAGVGAWAALELGRRQRALELFDLLLQVDPGTLRRLDFKLPVVLRVADSSASAFAAELLTGSPRFLFEEDAAFAVEVQVDGAKGSACLQGSSGNRHGCAKVTARPGEDTEALARRLIAEFHQAVFALRIDLTQADIRSLDGAPTAAGGRASERILSVLSDILPGN